MGLDENMTNQLLTSPSASSISSSLSELSLCDSVDVVDNTITQQQREPGKLMSNLVSHEEADIRFVNMDHWKVRGLASLYFQLVNPTIEDAYKRMFRDMRMFYNNPMSCRFSVSVENLIEVGREVGVVMTPTGMCMRVRILSLDEDQEWEDFSDCDSVECSDDGEDDNGLGLQSPTGIRVIDMDMNITLSPEDVCNSKWFYLVEDFQYLPFRARECCLSDSEPFLDFFEFFDAAHDVLKEVVFHCKVDYVNENGIPFMTLTSPFFQVPVNEVIYRKTIEALPAPGLPPVGQAYDDAFLSHSENNGEIFLQFQRSPIFQLWERICCDLTEEDCVIVKNKRGPTHKISDQTIYLAPYDGTYYRCIRGVDTIHEDPHPELMDIYFIDYGNSVVIHSSELVPCYEVDPVLSFFPNMVVRAHLRNINGVCWKLVIGRMLKENATYVVETLTCPTSEEVAYVELMTVSRGDLLMLSDTLIKSKCASRWEENLLPGPTAYPALLSRIKDPVPSVIPMGSMDWSTDPCKEVQAHVGAIIEVEVTGKNDMLTIRPVTAPHKIKALRDKMDNWSFWKLLNSSWTPDEYMYYRWRSFILGNIVMVTHYSELKILSRDPGSPMYRGRLIDFNDEDKTFKVLNVDEGTLEDISPVNFHPLGMEFCFFPAQAALLCPSGFEGKLGNIPATELIGRRFVVQVDSTELEDSYKSLGRLIVKGKIFLPRVIKRMHGTTKREENRSLSKTPEEAQGLNLGPPLTHRDFSKLGKYGKSL